MNRHLISAVEVVTARSWDGLEFGPVQASDPGGALAIPAMMPGAG